MTIWTITIEKATNGYSIRHEKLKTDPGESPVMATTVAKTNQQVGNVIVDIINDNAHKSLPGKCNVPTKE